MKGTSSADECLEQLTEFVPDVLLLEPALPRGESEHVFASIGNLSDRPFLPVVVLTLSSREADRDHPNIKHVQVKPQSLKEITKLLKRIGAANVGET